MKKWNPRYAAFAKFHGRTPAEQLTHDKKSDCCMMEFILWSSARLREWRETLLLDTFAKDLQPFGEMHETYNAWLKKRG